MGVRDLGDKCSLISSNDWNFFLFSPSKKEKMEQISKAELLGGEISCNTTPNYLCVPSAEILKVVLIETDLVGMPGPKDE